ncbi:hypothetical protein [Rheinheimera aquimaris]|jgi:hypothetical protein|uniref:hypothetical protein n=1 Tax=Rheinheimera aquimaris TaxID=412437 RepID=UPI001065CB7A|nr:hypothetical protein [Rheinheimera aquimaris]
MPSELIAVLGTLLGALIGGLINYFANRSAKKHEWSLALAKDNIALRQKLYSEFLVETQRLVIIAADKKVSSASDFSSVGGKFAEISLIAPDCVVRSAKTMLDAALETNSKSKSNETSNFYEIKKAFISHARQDIESMHECP